MMNSSNFHTGPNSGIFRPNVSSGLGLGRAVIISDFNGTGGPGYNAAAGVRDNVAFGAEARLVPATGVTPLPTAMSLTYVGAYEVAAIKNADQRVGTPEETSGTITLIADLNAGTLTGNHNDLTVSGQLTGQDIAGTVTFRGLEGQLIGLAGGNVSVGAFHGSSTDVVYAGGFVAPSQ